MEDNRIIAQFFDRDERAIAAAQEKYGKLCHSVAMNILGRHEDAEECVNDTWVQVWGAIPPERPQILSAYLCHITRNLALSRLRLERREKRGGAQVEMALDELHECVADLRDADETSADNLHLRQALDTFLRCLPERTRRIFLQRYWFARPVADIAAEFHLSEGHVKVILHRARGKLHDYLGKEGIKI